MIPFPHSNTHGFGMTGTLLLLAWTPPVWLVGLLNLGLWIVGLFLILIILLQSGKGGGLAGAFGGAGGQSAFGSRMGDEFTKITLYVALVWFLMLMLVIKLAPQAVEAAVPGPEGIQSTEGAPAGGATEGNPLGLPGLPGLPAPETPAAPAPEGK